MKYECTIKTKQKFTDKPMLVGSLMGLAAFFTGLGIYAAQYPHTLEEFKRYLAEQLTLKTFMNSFGWSIMVSLVASQTILVLLFLIPVVIIHLSIIGLIVFNIWLGVTFLSLVALFNVLSLGIIYALYFKSIGKASKLIRVISQILLNNTLATTLFIAVGTLVTQAAMVPSTVGLYEQYRSKELLVLAGAWSLFVIYLVIFLGYAGDVYFGRVVFKYLVGVAEKRTRSVTFSAVKRVCLSAGTIFLATAISFVIFLLRMGVNYLNERNRQRNGIASLLIAVMLFLASLVLYIIDVAAETINTYVLVYNSIFGAGYRKSMSGAFDIVQKRFSLCRPAMLLVSLPFLFFNTLGVVFLNYLLQGRASFDAELIKTGVSALLITAMYLSSVTSGFLCLEFLIYEDAKLINTVYPGLFASLGELGYTQM